MGNPRVTHGSPTDVTVNLILKKNNIHWWDIHEYSHFFFLFLSTWQGRPMEDPLSTHGRSLGPAGDPPDSATDPWATHGRPMAQH